MDFKMREGASMRMLAPSLAWWKCTPYIRTQRVRNILLSGEKSALCGQTIDVLLHFAFGLNGMGALDDCAATFFWHGGKRGECLRVFCQRHTKAHGKLTQIDILYQYDPCLSAPVCRVLFPFSMFFTATIYSLEETLQYLIKRGRAF